MSKRSILSIIVRTLTMTVKVTMLILCMGFGRKARGKKINRNKKRASQKNEGPLSVNEGQP